MTIRSAYIQKGTALAIAALATLTLALAVMAPAAAFADDKTITRFAGSTRYDTSRLVGNYAYSQGLTPSGVAIVVSGEKYPDAVIGSGLAGIYRAPVLLTTSDSLSQETREAIAFGGVRRVIVMGDTYSVSTAVESQIKSLGCSVERVCGSTRQGTAEAAYRSVPADSWRNTWNAYKTPDYINWTGWKTPGGKKMAIIVRGDSFPDALSAAPNSAYSHYPIFYTTDSGGLTDETLSILRNGKFDEVQVVGDEYAISSETASIAAQAVKPQSISDGNIKPGTYWYWGMIDGYDDNRYATSYSMAAGKLSESPATSFAVATGNNFPDALTIGTLQGLDGGKFMLVADGNSSYALRWLNNWREDVLAVRIAGDGYSVSSAIENALLNAWKSGAAPTNDSDSADLYARDPFTAKAA